MAFVDLAAIANPTITFRDGDEIAVIPLGDGRWPEILKNHGTSESVGVMQEFLGEYQKLKKPEEYDHYFNCFLNISLRRPGLNCPRDYNILCPTDVSKFCGLSCRLLSVTESQQ